MKGRSGRKGAPCFRPRPAAAGDAAHRDISAQAASERRILFDPRLKK